MAAKYSETITTRAGTVLSNVKVQALDSNGVAQTLYTDVGLTTVATPENTAVYSNEEGLAEFYIADGTYTIVHTYRSTTKTFANVELYDLSNLKQLSSDLASTASGKGVDLVARAVVAPKPQDYSAVGNGSTDDTTPISTLDALTAKKYLPAGTYDTTLASTALNGPFWGEGQIRDNSNNKRAPWFSAIKTAPSSIGNWDSPETAFNGDLTHMQRATEHRISGATTLGQPATGYEIKREAGATFDYAYVASDAGHNQSTSTNDGRTGAVPWGRQLFHAGNGDAFLDWASAIATGTKVGSTIFLANPAISRLAGQMLGGADSVFLQGIGDLNFEDQGYDVAAQGVTFNFIRTNDTGAKGADWTALRLQSIGSKAINAWGAFVGKANIGFDFTKSDFGTNQAALTLAPDQRIYGNSANADTNSLSRYTSVGNAWFVYSSSISGWNFIVGGTSAFQITAAQVSTLFAFKQRTYTVATLPVGSAGVECYVSDANATTRLSIAAGGGANFVKVFYNGTNWLIQ